MTCRAPPPRVALVSRRAAAGPCPPPRRPHAPPARSPAPAARAPPCPPPSAPAPLDPPPRGRRRLRGVRRRPAAARAPPPAARGPPFAGTIDVRLYTPTAARSTSSRGVPEARARPPRRGPPGSCPGRRDLRQEPAGTPLRGCHPSVTGTSPGVRADASASSSPALLRGRRHHGHPHPPASGARLADLPRHRPARRRTPPRYARPPGPPARAATAPPRSHRDVGHGLRSTASGPGRPPGRSPRAGAFRPSYVGKGAALRAPARRALPAREVPPPSWRYRTLCRPWVLGFTPTTRSSTRRTAQTPRRPAPALDPRPGRVALHPTRTGSTSRPPGRASARRTEAGSEARSGGDLPLAPCSRGGCAPAGVRRGAWPAELDRRGPRLGPSAHGAGVRRLRRPPPGPLGDGYPPLLRSSSWIGEGCAREAIRRSAAVDTAAVLGYVGAGWPGAAAAGAASGPSRGLDLPGAGVGPLVTTWAGPWLAARRPRAPGARRRRRGRRGSAAWRCGCWRRGRRAGDVLGTSEGERTTTGIRRTRSSCARARRSTSWPPTPGRWRSSRTRSHWARRPGEGVEGARRPRRLQHGVGRRSPRRSASASAALVSSTSSAPRALARGRVPPRLRARLHVRGTSAELSRLTAVRCPCSPSPPQLGAVWTDEAAWPPGATSRSPPPRRSTAPRAETSEAIRAATFTVEAVKEREQVTDHDVAAFVDVLAASAGPAGALDPLRA